MASKNPSSSSSAAAATATAATDVQAYTYIRIKVTFNGNSQHQTLIGVDPHHGTVGQIIEKVCDRFKLHNETSSGLGLYVQYGPAWIRVQEVTDLKDGDNCALLTDVEASAAPGASVPSDECVPTDGRCVSSSSSSVMQAPVPPGSSSVHAPSSSRIKKAEEDPPARSNKATATMVTGGSSAVTPDQDSFYPNSVTSSLSLVQKEEKDKKMKQLTASTYQGTKDDNPVAAKSMAVVKQDPKQPPSISKSVGGSNKNTKKRPSKNVDDDDDDDDWRLAYPIHSIVAVQWDDGRYYEATIERHGAHRRAKRKKNQPDNRTKKWAFLNYKAAGVKHWYDLDYTPHFLVGHDNVVTSTTARKADTTKSISPAWLNARVAVLWSGCSNPIKEGTVTKVRKGMEDDFLFVEYDNGDECWSYFHEETRFDRVWRDSEGNEYEESGRLLDENGGDGKADSQEQDDEDEDQSTDGSSSDGSWESANDDDWPHAYPIQSVVAVKWDDRRYYEYTIEQHGVEGDDRHYESSKEQRRPIGRAKEKNWQPHQKEKWVFLHEQANGDKGWYDLNQYKHFVVDEKVVTTTSRRTEATQLEHQMLNKTITVALSVGFGCQIGERGTVTKVKRSRKRGGTEGLLLFVERDFGTKCWLDPSIEHLTEPCSDYVDSEDDEEEESDHDPCTGYVDSTEDDEEESDHDCDYHEFCSATNTWTRLPPP